VDKNASNTELASEWQVSKMRAALGTLQWMAGHWRPDLSTQTSLCQQTMPQPTIDAVRKVNAVIRRAKQDPRMCVNLVPVSMKRLTLFGHTDSALGNAKGGGSQAGYLIGAGDACINTGEEGQWGLVSWRSGRLRRVVASSLSAEAQAALNATRELHWVATLITEFVVEHLDLSDREATVAKTVPTVLIVDAKALYDLLRSPTGGGRDRESGVDVIILRDALKKFGTDCRWVPGTRQLADGMTKDTAESIDALKAAVLRMVYNIGDERRALELRAVAREARVQRGQARKIENERIPGKDKPVPK
jgi:hypothetical protein